MALYEHVFIARQDISEQQVEAITSQISNIVQEYKGTIGKSEYWGLRSLAYRVKKNRKGHYSLLNISANHDAIAEVERQLSLHDDVLRFMTLRVEEHETGPSSPMKNKNREEQRRAERRDYNDSASESEGE
jgi:small subunit ribosomal protein S6